MERRFIIAALLAFLVLYGWQALFVRPVPRPTPGASTAQSTQGGGTSAPERGTSAAGATVAERPVPPTTAASIVGEPVERDIRVETRDVIAVFTNRGARLKSWRLKHYLNANKEPLELVAGELAGAQPLPFSLRVPDRAMTATLNDALYAATALGGGAAAASAPTQLTFEYKNDAGLRAVKEFRLEPSSYLVSFHAIVTDGDRAVAPALVWGPGLADATAAASRWDVKPEALFSSAGKVQRIVAANVVKQPTYEQGFEYAGVDDTYFMTIALRPGTSKLTYEPVSIPPVAGSKDPARALMSYAIEPAKRDEAIKFYVGPKSLEAVSAIDPDLVRAINFGIWSFIVVPLLKTLNWINGMVGNYGWSIIILTVILNVLQLPLQHKQVVSMRKMQELQPQVKAIQDRYSKIKATDPAKQKMNQEMMALYRERGVNPASGCVPMLLMFPLVFAFYGLLTAAIELRGAPFIGWVHDLSQPDPYYVTPLLMGVTMLWQQLITPAAGMDPTQQKIMLIMPVMMTFLFLNYPSGVALYWLMANVWRIGQQYLTNQLIGPPNVPNVRPPAERRLKRVGGGKTEAADANSKAS
jgi:YidC/Oxa1 family membrane protein insertase